MKILVICQHYWPEPFVLDDVCEELVKRGHTVHVVTGVPNYPMGRIYEDYRNGKNRTQERGGVRITRTFTVGRRQNVFFRFLNYFSYAISSTRYIHRLKEEYDVVYTNQLSPIIMVNAAMAYAKKWNKKVVLYCMDLWPASLAAGGISQRSLIYKIFSKVSGWLYRKADRILVTSRMFQEYFEKKFNIGADIVGYLPQYADNRFDTLPEHEKDETVDLMFAGNIGTAQSIPTILRAAKILEDNKQLRWHIIGDGSELENSKKLTEELQLQNVIFYGRKPMTDMPMYYAKADAMLLTLTEDPFISMTLPGKAQTYMAAGKPIIAAGNGEIRHVLSDADCGFCGPAESAEGLANAVRQFLEHPNREELGKNARLYYEQHFTRNMFMDSLEQELKSACQL